MKIEDLAAYQIIEKRDITDLNSVSYILKHKKTGAKVALLSNDDENKVFYIGFRTPPADSTGVAHILEHSVLCGSKNFPVKDPFVELVKGSLNTFLNAMTYPDKTVYPVASCNDKDFQNLLHVYLDAVFYPNIYRESKIFAQEGWHYEMEDKEDSLTINGVVYNEMKGAFSSADDMLERQILNSLYPDTTYGIESGGDPVVIPELTYEEFLAFHGKFYHPSNSYIYLYGNMDMAEKLDYIDKEYLSSFDALKVDSEIKKQESFKKMNNISMEYPIGDGESEKDNAYLALNYSVGDSLDKELYVAFQILDYALCSAPGAPLKQALVDKGIGKDIYSIYENGMIQPFFCVVSKNVDENKKKEFLTTIQEVLEELVKKGLDKKALLAGINYFEFKYREADFGSYPKGLMYGLQMLDSWLYDENMPFVHVEANETFKKLREKVNENYFENLIQQFLLDNQHKACVTLIPKKGLTKQKDEELAAKLRTYKDSLSDAEIAHIVESTKALREYQEAEDSPENLAKIPLLTREDLKRETVTFSEELRKAGDTDILYHPIFTNGIGYLRLIFSLNEIPAELFPYIGIFKGCLGLLDTANYKYGDLYNEINIVTGGMAVVNNVYTRIEDTKKCQVTLELKTKVLFENLAKAFAFLEEIMFTTNFCDKKRLYEIIAEGKSRMQSQMTSAGHSVALNRALSYVSNTAALNEELSGISFYRLIEKLEADFEHNADELCEKLNQLKELIFRPENMMVDYVSNEEGYEKLPALVENLRGKLYRTEVKKGHFEPVPSKKNEGFCSSSQIQYVCRAGNFRDKGLSYTGALKVLKVMMGYEYLWENVRVKGGAYGCMCNFGKSGECFFVSYRDPNLSKTIQVYEKAADYIAQYEADERTLTQYIIGAISELDMPMNPAAKGLFELSAYMTGVTREILQKERDEILLATPKTLQETSKMISAFMEDDCLCVIGNTEKIKSESSLFGETEELFQ